MTNEFKYGEDLAYQINYPTEFVEICAREAKEFLAKAVWASLIGLGTAIAATATEIPALNIISIFCAGASGYLWAQMHSVEGLGHHIQQGKLVRRNSQELQELQD